MDENELTALLRTHDRHSGRTWRCPDENQIAAYVDGQTGKRQKMEKHFSECKACLETISLLVTQLEKDEFVPPPVLARARRLADSPNVGNLNWRWTFAAASACVLIVSAIALWQLKPAPITNPPTDLVAQANEPQLPGKEPGAKTEATLSPTPLRSNDIKRTVKESPAPVVRGADVGSRLTMVFPREGSTVRLPLPSLRWVAVNEAAFYEVRIVTPDGAPVVTQSTNTNALQLSPDVLKPDSEYFVTVVAHLSGNRVIKTQPVKFRVAEVR